MSSESYRINTYEIDQSNSISPDTNNIGAVVVAANKGPEQPIKIKRGDSKRILNVFGKPTSSNTQIYEALKYNEQAPIWISAPSRNGKYGGVYITKEGTEAFTSGFSSKLNVDFDLISAVETVGVGDGSTTNFILTLNDYTHYNNVSLLIKKNGTTLAAYNITNAATEVITATDLTSGSYVRATGVLNLTFTAAPLSTDTITAEYTVNRANDVYAILFNKNPQIDDLGIQTQFNDSDDTFTIYLNIKDEDGNYAPLTGSPFIVSMTNPFKDGFGNNIYIEKIFEESDFITPVVNTALAVTTFQVETNQIELLAIGDGSSKAYTLTLNKYSNYINQSIDITVGGTTINVTASNAATEILTTFPSVGSGTYVRATGLLSFTFLTAPVADSVINATYKSNEAIDSAIVDMAGGDRGSSVTGSDLVRGWEYFKQSNTYAADIFFDVSANPNIPSVFNVLRNTYQKYKAFILPLPRSTSTASKATKTSYGIANRGVYYYWNYFRILNAYNDDTLWTPATGAIAKKHAQMVDVYNGLPPAWIDENGRGGQLDISVVEQAYDPDEDTLKDLDKAHINPIHNDITYGPMIKSQRTSITNDGDYSFISRSRIADYIISNVVIQVLPFQIIKLNDAPHRTQVKSKATTIVSPLAADPFNLLRGYLIQCDEKNNNDDILNQNKFVLRIAVKFTPSSELIDFFFVNTPQGVEIT